MTDSPRRPTTIGIKLTKRPPLDYRECLKAIGVEFRHHAYRQEQVRLLSGDLIDLEKPGKHAVNGDSWRDWRFDRIEIDNDKDIVWRDLCPLIEDTIYMIVQERCRLYTPKTDKTGDVTGRSYYPVNIDEASRKIAVNDQMFRKKVNPLLDWLNRLTPSNTPQDILGECFTIEISEEFVKRINKDYGLAEIKQYCLDWIAMLGKGVYLRTKTPGSHFSFFSVIAGAQGVGKSMLSHALLPPHLADDCHHSGLDLAAKVSEKIQFCQGGAIIECDELAGYGRKGLASLKAFISNRKSRIRPPYGKRYENTKRHFIIYGTTNDEQFLALDPSGDRRHMPMFVSCRAGWSGTEVGDKLPQTMDKLRAPFWQWIKYLVEVKGEECRYTHWATSSLEIRDALIDRSVKRPYTVEKALDELLRPENDMFAGSCLTEDERISGIYLDVPPSSSRRSIMKLLPANITSLYTSQFVGQVLNRQGWMTVARNVIEGTKCQLRVPPEKTRSIKSNSEYASMVDKEVPIESEAMIERDTDGIYYEQKRQARKRERDLANFNEDDVLHYINRTKPDDDDGWYFPITIKQALAPTDTSKQGKIDRILNKLVDKEILQSKPYGLTLLYRVNT